MPDLVTGFELEDTKGSTEQFNGSVTTAIDIPSVADKVISELIIQNVSKASRKVLQLSFDGGSTYFDISRFGHLAWTLKGPDMRQVRIKSSDGTAVDYQAIINFEEY
jgi:hypothetical protein